MEFATKHTGDLVSISPANLIAERMLITGASGSGKSYLLRKLIESSLERGFPTTVIDVEGEYTTLPNCSVIPIGEITDTAAAYALAESSNRHRQSIVLDLSECTDGLAQLHAYFEALIALPATHRTPRLVTIDEAHTICPQVGKAICKRAVSELLARGRKRGIATVLATQRLSKLDKNSAAECRNILVGQTTIDSDVKACCSALGIVADATNRLRIKSLQHEFLAFGPSLGLTPQTIRSLPPQTKPDNAFDLSSIATPEHTITIQHEYKTSAARVVPLVCYSVRSNYSNELAQALAIADWIGDTKPNPASLGRVLAGAASVIGRDFEALIGNVGNPPDLRLWWPSPVWYEYTQYQHASPLDSVLRGHVAYQRIGTMLSQTKPQTV